MLGSPRCMEEAHGEVEVLNEADKGKPLQPALSWVYIRILGFRIEASRVGGYLGVCGLGLRDVIQS